MLKDKLGEIRERYSACEFIDSEAGKCVPEMGEICIACKTATDLPALLDALEISLEAMPTCSCRRGGVIFIDSDIIEKRRTPVICARCRALKAINDRLGVEG